MERRDKIGLAILAALGVVFVIVVKNRGAIASAVADLGYTPPPHLADAFAAVQALYQQAASDSGVPYALLARQGQQESGFNPDASNPSGASGIAQLLPQYHPGVDVWDPADAIPNGQASDMANYYNVFGTWAKAAAAYFWGPGNLQKAIKAAGDNWLAVAPTETRRYVGQILTDVPIEPLPAGALT